MPATSGWPRNPLNESAEQKSTAKDIRSNKLKTARAWQIKETLMDFFNYVREADARKYFGMARPVAVA